MKTGHEISITCLTAVQHGPQLVRVVRELERVVRELVRVVREVIR